MFIHSITIIGSLTYAFIHLALLMHEMNLRIAVTCLFIYWTQLSLASVAVDQVFTNVAIYRGTIVRTKELCFSKRREICRKTMKEMRLMREIRHDNINPFIGAVVEPNRIRIVSEYCHKGSLPVRKQTKNMTFTFH